MTKKTGKTVHPRNLNTDMKKSTQSRLEKHARYHSSRMGTAEERASTVRRNSFKLMRTIALGTVAVIAGFFWVGEQYGIDREMMLDYLTSSLLFVAFLAGIGVLGAFLLAAFKRITRK
ncbi:MAG: hypothetical protein AAF541_23025 [Pseudomonadota bacterium]